MVVDPDKGKVTKFNIPGIQCDMNYACPYDMYKLGNNSVLPLRQISTSSSTSVHFVPSWVSW